MTMITPSYLGETIEYSSLHACRSTLEDPTRTSVGHYRRHQDSRQRAWGCEFQRGCRLLGAFTSFRLVHLERRLPRRQRSLT